MPHEYEQIRDSLIHQGRSEKEAKRIAAATYNKRHPGHPLESHRKPGRPRDKRKVKFY